METETDEYKLTLYSDFHKDVFGYRPRNCHTREERIAAYDAAASHFAALKQTPEGREALRADGWDV